MSPVELKDKNFSTRAPRVSGDEPITRMQTMMTAACSPRERG